LITGLVWFTLGLPGLIDPLARITPYASDTGRMIRACINPRKEIVKRDSIQYNASSILYSVDNHPIQGEDYIVCISRFPFRRYLSVKLLDS